MPGKYSWTLVVRTADSQPIAVVDHPITAARLISYLCAGSDSPRSALRTVPATAKTLPRQKRNGELTVELSWWRIVASQGHCQDCRCRVLLAAFLLEPHARGWHELETAGQALLLGPGQQTQEE